MKATHMVHDTCEVLFVVPKWLVTSLGPSSINERKAVGRVIVNTLAVGWTITKDSLCHVTS